MAAATQKLCTGTCLWKFDGANWTVQSSSCSGSCGCLDPATRSSFTSASGSIEVPHANFVKSAGVMQGDARVDALPRGPLMRAQASPSSAASGAVYETPCME
jgi:hypothetical protein